jgi:GT2 family glycosyltransferase
MKGVRYYLRRVVSDPACLIQALKNIHRRWLEQGIPGVLALLAPDRFSAGLYRRWLRRYPMPPARVAAGPRFTLLLAIEPDTLEHIDRTLASIHAQSITGWELLIACPSRFAAAHAALVAMSEQDARLVLRSEEDDSAGGQWNRLLPHAGGSHVVPLTPGYCLHPELLAHLTAAFTDPDRQCVFWDTDRLDSAQRRHSPYFRPAWNLSLARACPAYVEIMAVSKTRLQELQGFSDAGSAASQYDLLLRIAERLTPAQFHRLPRVLSHRQTAPADADSVAALQSVLQAHFRRCAINARVTPVGRAMEIRFTLPDPPPPVAIVMPTRDGGRRLHRAVISVLNMTDYPDFMLYVIDNGSREPETLAQLAEYAAHPRCRVLRDPRPFNFSALNNRAVAQVDAPLVCLLNDDVEVIAPGWLADMAAAAVQPDIGAVGARLWYPDGALQHAGVILGYGGGAGHAYKARRRPAAGEFDPSALMREFSAVTAACLVAKRALFEEVGGFDERHFPVNFNDVDFCLKLRKRGYRNLYVPTAELWHRESATRGSDVTPAQRARFAGEVAMLRTRWAGWIADDPAYNPNLTLRREDFSLAWPPRHASALPPPP